jgi:hypothetical protein
MKEYGETGCLGVEEQSSGRRPGDRPKGRANRDAALRAGDLGPAIWRAGSTSGALLAGIYQADAKDGVARPRRYVMNGLMDGLIAGYLM